jgi:hypothetical protein
VLLICQAFADGLLSRDAANSVKTRDIVVDAEVKLIKYIRSKTTRKNNLKAEGGSGGVGAENKGPEDAVPPAREIEVAVASAPAAGGEEAAFPSPGGVERALATGRTPRERALLTGCTNEPRQVGPRRPRPGPEAEEKRDGSALQRHGGGLGALGGGVEEEERGRARVDVSEASSLHSSSKEHSKEHATMGGCGPALAEDALGFFAPRDKAGGGGGGGGGEEIVLREVGKLKEHVAAMQENLTFISSVCVGVHVMCVARCVGM